MGEGEDICERRAAFRVKYVKPSPEIFGLRGWRGYATWDRN